MRPIALLFLATAAMSEEQATEKPSPFTWSQYQFFADHDNYRERKDGIVWPKVLWHVPDVYGQPTLRDGKLYSGGPSLACIDALTGKVLRRVPAGGKQDTYAQAPVLTGRLVIARRSDGRTQAFAPDLKSVVWEVKDPEFKNGPVSTGCWTRSFYYFATGHRVCAIDTREGHLDWLWSHPQQSSIRMVPACDGDRVYAGSISGTFVALNYRTGKRVWVDQQQVAYGGSSPIVVENRVIIADREGRDRAGALQVFSAKSGKWLWDWKFKESDCATPGHAPGLVLLGFSRTAMALNLRTRKDASPRIRTGPNPFGSPTLVGSTIYVGSQDGNLYAHELSSGRLLWRFHVPGSVSVPLDTGGTLEVPHQAHDFIHTGARIYASTSNGLYCLGQDPAKSGKKPEGAVIEPTK